MAVDFTIRYAGERLDGPDDRGILGGSCHVEAGAVPSLTLELPPSHPMARIGAFAELDATREVTLSQRYADGSEYEVFRGWITDARLDEDLVMTIECEGMLAYLQNTRVRPWAPRALTGLSEGTTIVNGDAFEWLVEQHNLNGGSELSFEVGVNPHAEAPTGSDDYRTTWDELNDKFCTGQDRFLHARSDRWGRRCLDLLDGGAGEGTQAIVVGENVVEMSLDETSRRVVTAIIARGQTDDEYKSGAGERIDRRDIGVEGADVGIIVGNCSNVTVDRDRAVNWDMVAAYGLLEEKRDYDATTPEDLARMAAADLNPDEIGTSEVRAFDVSAVDLHATNPDVQPIRLLDWTEVFIRADGQVSGDAKGRLVFHGWLPCTSIDYDLGDPADTRYHFGDLPETLTRQSALRLGMLRRGNGTLVRRAGATAWDNDRVWNRTDDIWEHADDVGDEVRGELADATKQWSDHLDEEFDAYTQQWYESLDGVSKEAAQGREELLKHIDEVAGEWSDDLSALSGTVDENHRELLDGIRDVAESAQRTFFGTCADSDSVRRVTNLTRPGGTDFTLAKGVVVDVLMTHGWAGACTLNVQGTGAIEVRTNGAPWGVWQDGQVVRFLYDGASWQACSTDIYGETLTVGHPQHANVHCNGNVLEARIGQTSYWHVGVDGERIGLLDQSHVDIGSDGVDVVNRTGGSVHFGYGDNDEPTIETRYGLFISGNGHSMEEGDSYILLSSSGNTYVNGSTVDISAHVIRLNNNPVKFASISFSANGSTYDVAPSMLGLTSANGYAWVASNGDLGAQGAAVTSASYNPSTRGIRLHFSSNVSGAMRVNLVGIPLTDMAVGDEPGEGPEMFDSDTGASDENREVG